MAGRGSHGPDLSEASLDASAAGHAGAVSVPHSGSSTPTTARKYINHRVAGHAGQAAARNSTKSRGRDAPATTRWWRRKNGAVVRKHMGYGVHIAAEHAEALGRVLRRGASIRISASTGPAGMPR